MLLFATPSLDLATEEKLKERKKANTQGEANTSDGERGILGGKQSYVFSCPNQRATFLVSLRFGSSILLSIKFLPFCLSQID